MKRHHRIQQEFNFILYPATSKYERQYCAYTTWWLGGKYDGSTMLRVVL